jgi:hypothetical protein
MKPCLTNSIANPWLWGCFGIVLGALLVLGYAIPSHAKDFLDDDEALKSTRSFNFPGGVAQLRLPKLSSSLPVVNFGMAEPPIIESENDWRILIGLDLAMIPGQYLVYVKHSDTDLLATSLKFNVAQKTYPITNIKDVRSAARTLGISHDSFSDIDFKNSEQPNFPLKLPIDGTWVDAFGSIAASNDPLSVSSETLVQNYVYLSSAELSIITAPQNAMVSRIIQGPEPEALATVFLDHGRGVYSILTGVADLSVEVGNGVIAGAIIGRLPANINNDQYSTLVWQSIVNGVYVNPLILTELD